MRWFRKDRAVTAEALDLALAGTAPGSAAAGELLRVADALRQSSATLPAPWRLRARRDELVGLGVAATAASASRGRALRPMLIAFALAGLLTVAALGAALVSSWLQGAPQPQPGSGAVVVAPSPRHAAGITEGPSTSASPPPAAEPRSTSDASCAGGGTATAEVADDLAACDVGTDHPPPESPLVGTVDQLARDLLTLLVAACGEDTDPPELGGLEENAARELVDAMVAACEAALESPVPHASAVDALDELAAELLVTLREACAEDAELPELDGLDEAAARELVDAMVAACEMTIVTPLP